MKPPRIEASQSEVDRMLVLDRAREIASLHGVTFRTVHGKDAKGIPFSVTLAERPKKDGSPDVVAFLTGAAAQVAIAANNGE
jgi:hypothetical protein